MKRVAIVGAGLSGLTAAYILRKNYTKVDIDIYESRVDEIGGNCYDINLNNKTLEDIYDIYDSEHCYDEYDINYMQQYGPHIFHTNHKFVWNFVNNFSDFEYYQHKVLSYIDGQYYRIPLTKTFMEENNIILKNLNSKKINANNAEEYLYKILGKEVTDKFFKYYSEKMWGIPFNELPVDIVKRIPIRDNDDPRYFTDKYQGMPYYGYTYLCNEILSFTKANVIYQKVLYEDLISKKDYDFIILTGKPDDFFSEKYGKLKYKYTRFVNRLEINDGVNTVINYPKDYDFIRTTEYDSLFKRFSNREYGYKCYEYPVDIGKEREGDEPCYPILFDKNNNKIFERYLYNKPRNVIFIGRLAENKYLNMDATIYNAFEKMNKYCDVEKIKYELLQK